MASDMIGPTVSPRVESPPAGVSPLAVFTRNLASTEPPSGRGHHENGPDHGSRSAGIGDEAALARVQGEVRRMKIEPNRKSRLSGAGQNLSAQRMVSWIVARTLCAVLFAACAEKSISTTATGIDDAAALQASLAFLQDGKTTREEVRNRLGAPSGEFDQGRIWTYSKLNVVRHVVIVFGDQDIVKTHRLVEIK